MMLSSSVLPLPHMCGGNSWSGGVGRVRPSPEEQAPATTRVSNELARVNNELIRVSSELLVLKFLLCLQVSMKN